MVVDSNTFEASPASQVFVVQMMKPFRADLQQKDVNKLDSLDDGLVNLKNECEDFFMSV